MKNKIFMFILMLLSFECVYALEFTVANDGPCRRYIFPVLDKSTLAATVRQACASGFARMSISLW